MKLMKQIEIIAIYKGIVPVEPYGGSLGTWGIRKYIGYDHLFTDVHSVNYRGSFCYTKTRAKSLPKEIPIDSKVRMIANFRSSIISKILLIEVIEQTIV